MQEFSCLWGILLASHNMYMYFLGVAYMDSLAIACMYLLAEACHVHVGCHFLALVFM